MCQHSRRSTGTRTTARSKNETSTHKQDCSSTLVVGSQWATSVNALILTNPTFAPAATVATRPARTLCGIVNTNISIFLISKFPKSESTLKNARHSLLSRNHSFPVCADGTKTQTTNNNYQTDSQQFYDPYERQCWTKTTLRGGLYSGHISIDYQTAHNQERECTTDPPANLVTMTNSSSSNILDYRKKQQDCTHKNITNCRPPIGDSSTNHLQEPS